MTSPPILSKPLEASQQADDALPRIHRFQLSALLQAVLLLLLYALPALRAVRVAAVGDPDIWWHLRTAEWMLAHHAVPHTDPFSASAAGKPWAAYSWLFELVMSELFQHFGLVGILAYTSFMMLGISVSLSRLVQRLAPQFSAGVVLVYAACFSMSHLLSPRPWLISILFLVLELDLLLRTRQGGDVRSLWWLPLLFVVWANSHIQFVVGLLVLVLFVLDRWIAQPRKPNGLPLPPWPLCAILLASAFATLCNPYGWHIYQVAHDLAAQPDVINQIDELKAMPFRDSADWCVLLLTAAATGALAWSRTADFFELSLLLLASISGFRSQRDVWILALAATTVIAPRLRLAGTPKRFPVIPELRTMSALGAVLVILVVLFQSSRCPGQLDSTLAARLPVRALDFVEAHHLHGPVLNDYTWGGYVMWRLHQPVSLDGRAALYGSPCIQHFDDLWRAQPGWDTAPELSQAGFVIGSAQSPLVQVLRLDPRFQLAYADALAAVFVRR